MKTEDRKFVLTVGGAFAVLALIFLWRGKSTGAWIAGGLAVLLLALLLIAPSTIAPIRAAWMKGAHAMSRVTTPIILGIVYYLVLTPTGLIRRAMGKSSLRANGESGSYWVTRATKARPATDMRRQF